MKRPKSTGADEYSAEKSSDAEEKEEKIKLGRGANANRTAEGVRWGVAGWSRVGAG